jgi:hypothetical protein
MVLEFIGMAIGSSMIEDGKRDCKTAKQFERQNNDIEAKEYQTSGKLKKSSGFLLSMGSAISLGAEILGYKK